MQNNVIKLKTENIFTEVLIRAKDMKKIFWNVADSTFSDWAKKGLIRRHKIEGSVFYKLSDIKRLIKESEE